MAPPTLKDNPKDVDAPKRSDGPEAGSELLHLVERSFAYNGTGLNKAFADAAANKKLVVVVTGGEKVPGTKEFILKQLPNYLNSDVLLVYLDVEKAKDETTLQGKLARKAGSDGPQLIVFGVKPDENKKPVIDEDSLVLLTPGNKEKYLKIVDLTKKDLRAPDQFDIPKGGKDASALGLPNVDLVDDKKLPDEEAQRKAMEGLAKLFLIQQKEKLEKREKELKAREAVRAAYGKFVYGESDEIYKKYPELKDFDEKKRIAWFREKFPLLDHAQFDASYKKAWDDATSRWNSFETNSKLGGEAGGRVFKQRDKQWKEFLELGGSDSAEGRKAYMVACDMAKDRAYPRFSRDDQKKYFELVDYAVDELIGVICDRCAPGAPNRDLASWMVTKFLAFDADKTYKRTKLYEAFRELAKPDKSGPAPLPPDIYRHTVHSILELNSRGVKDWSGTTIISLCLEDLKKFNNPDSAEVVDTVLGRSSDKWGKDVIRALTDLSSQLKRGVGDRWTEQVPQPFAKEKDRASDLKAALDKYLPKLAEGTRNTEASDEIVGAIARNYKFYVLNESHTESIAQLKRVFDCKDAPARIAAARVFLSSGLPEDNPDRKKAMETLVAVAVDKNSGARFREEAMDMLDDLVTSGKSVKIGEYKLSKEPEIGFVIEDGKRNWCTVNSSGDLVEHEFDTKIYEGRYIQVARILLEPDSIKVEYKKDSQVTSRTAKFEGDDLKEISWTEAGRFGPFVATRVKEEGRYTNKYKLTIPPTDKNSLPSNPIEITGTFELRRDGFFKFVGVDWVKGTDRILCQTQGVNDTAVRSYTNKP
jgi:hypothetical protein